MYVAGACIGALFFGQLTDRFGRKQLFMITLGVYTARHRADGLLDEPHVVLRRRFLTGAGIGGEYAAINSAIDELIPAKYRGRVDIAINGSFWVGAAAGVAADDPAARPDRRRRLVRLAPGVRPRRDPRARRPARPPQRAREPALAVHPRPRGRGRGGRPRHRARGARGDRPRAGRGRRDAHRSASAARSAIPLIAKTVFTLYPKRTMLCFSLFVGQAFLYNAFFFTYGDTLSTFFGVSQTGYYIAVFAVSNFVGALLLARCSTLWDGSR